MLVVTIVMSFLLVFSAHSVASENDFPDRPIRLIVPWAAGGGTDVLGRALVENAEEYLGVPVAVENITGGIGAVGLGATLAAEADGYTITFIDTYMDTIALQGRYPFTIDDFAPIIGLNKDPAALTVHADAPWETVDDFVEYARENPGAIRVGHAGEGMGWHLAGAGVAMAYDIELTYVPYDGAAPAITDLVGQHIEAVSVSGAEVSEFVRAGDLKVLAIMGDERMDLYPEVPTLLELGHDVQFYAMRGLAGPAGVPEERVQILHDAFYQMMQEPRFLEHMEDVGIGIYYSSYDDYEEVYRDSMEDVIELLEFLDLPIVEE